MLGFLIPIRHPAELPDYPRVWRRLNHTLHSLARVPDSRAYIACNEALPLDFPATVAEVDFGPMPPGLDVHGQVRFCFHDCWRKRRALVPLAAPDCAQLMLMDGDDFLCPVFRDLIGDPSETYILQGGIFLKGRQVRPTQRLNHYCGSSVILPRETALERIDHEQWLGCHQIQREGPHRAITLPSAAYNIHADNQGRDIWGYHDWDYPETLLQAEIERYGIPGDYFQMLDGG